MTARAEAAFEQLEGATGILALAAAFCAERESFGPFRDWVLARIDASGSADDPEVVAARESLECLTPDMLHGATGVLQMFLAGYGDRLKGIPDVLLDLMGRSMP